MTSRSLATLVATGLLAAASPALADPSARIVGTLVFCQRDRSVTVAEAQRLVHGKRIGLVLRSGWEVVPARLEGDGRFAADVAPGSWRLEWIDVGDRAEILAPPLELVASAGAPACAGRIEVAYADIESELGASAAGTVRVVGGCDASPGERGAGPPATGSIGRDLYQPSFGFQEIAEGIRVGGIFTDQEPGLRASWAVPLRRPLMWMGNIVAVAGASRTFASDGDHDAFEVGAGFVPYWGAELTGGLRWERRASGTAPWAALRLGPAPYALTVRADFRDGATWTFGLELSAFHLVGRFL